MFKYFIDYFLRSTLTFISKLLLYLVNFTMKCSAVGWRPKKLGSLKVLLPSSGCLISAHGDSVHAAIVQYIHFPLLSILSSYSCAMAGACCEAFSVFFPSS